MDTSLPSELGRKLLTVGLIMLSGCSAASTCSSINDSFSIYHWQAELPKSVLVHVVKRGADQEIRPTMVYRASLSRSDADRLGHILTLRPESQTSPELSANDDYRIVIDGHLEYRVHDIEMTDRANLGCPIRSAMVNECRIGQRAYVDFETDCSRPAQPASAAAK